MSNNLDNVIHQVVDQMEDSPIKNLLAGSFKTSIEKQKVEIEELMAAWNAGVLTQEELHLELEREKQIVEVEMLTWQIVGKAEVQKVVNKAFHLLQQAVL